MKRLLLALALLWSAPAWAQNPTCPTRPVGDSSNACASTAFVNAEIANDSRAKLTADRTYYVRTTGSDTNCSGLANVADPGTGTVPRACAFRTPQKPITVALTTLDLGGKSVTIDITGAYTTGILCSGTFLGGGTATPLSASSVIVTSTAGGSITTTSANSIEASQGCNLTVTGSLTLSTVTAGEALLAHSNGYIAVKDVIFGSVGNSHMQAGWVLSPTGFNTGPGTIEVFGSYSINCGAGCAEFHAHVPGEGSSIRFAPGITVTLTGTPGFTGSYWGASKGYIYGASVTYSGSATGVRYNVHNNGVLFGPAARTTLPGNAAGVVYAGGMFAIDDLNSDIGFSYMFGSEVVVPPSPAATFGTLWNDSTDHMLHFKNPSGTIGTMIVATDCTSTQFLRSLSAAGAVGCASTIDRLTITGTAGAGYLALASQSASPATGGSALRVYGDASTNFSWSQSDGFFRTITSALAANATYTFPAATATIARTDAGQTFTGTQTFNTPIAAGSGGTGVTTVAAEQARLFQGINIVSATAVNFNSVADTALAINMPTGYTRISVFRVNVDHCSATTTTAHFAVYTATAAGGALMVPDTTSTVSATADATANNFMTVNGSSVAAVAASLGVANTLQFRVTTPQGSAVTCDIALYYFVLP